MAWKAGRYDINLTWLAVQLPNVWVNRHLRPPGVEQLLSKRFNVTERNSLEAAHELFGGVAETANAAEKIK